MSTTESVASSATRQAYSLILELISSGELGPGTPVREPRIADALGISRTPVREALRLLSAEGLVKMTTHRGAVVASWTQEEIEELYGLRVLVEAYAARLASKKFTPGKTASLRTNLERYAQAVADDNVALAADLNDEFHMLLVENAGSTRLSALHLGVTAQPLVRSTFKNYSRRDLERSLRQHIEIVEAIEDGDVEWAETLTRIHFRSVLRVTPVAPTEDAESD